MMNSTYFCSFHIPKTGGTTFAKHGRESLGPDAFAPYGRFSNLRRFMNGEPQLEELPDEKKQAIRLVHGHGSSLRLAERIVGRFPEFVMFVRDPYDRFVSGYNHQAKNRPKQGFGAKSLEAYMRTRGENFLANSLVSHFSNMTKAEEADSFETVLPVLQSFKYILMTEHLDRQLPQLCKIIGMPGDNIEPQRVNAAKVSPDIDRATFDVKNRIDVEIYSALAAKAANGNAPVGNPFGYKPDALKQHLDAVWSKQTTGSILDDTYADLAKAAMRSSQLLAMHMKLTRTPADFVADKKALLSHVETALEPWLNKLDDEKKAVEYYWAAIVLRRAKQHADAKSYLDKALQLNPGNQKALRFQERLRNRQAGGNRARKKRDAEQAG